VSGKLNPLLEEFLDRDIPLPEIHWETMPPGVDPFAVWEAYDERAEGWTPFWFPTADPENGRPYSESERASLFDKDLERILSAMRKWPLSGSGKSKKHAVAIALLQLYCEINNLSERV